MSNELIELQHKLWLEQAITQEKYNQVRYSILALQVQIEIVKALRMAADWQRQLNPLPEYRVVPGSLT
jgi:hypothetical protein